MPYTYKGYTIELYRTSYERYNIDENGEIASGQIGSYEVRDVYNVFNEEGEIIGQSTDSDNDIYDLYDFDEVKEFIDELTKDE